LLAAAALAMLVDIGIAWTGPTLPPLPWDTGCVFMDGSFPFVHPCPPPPQQPPVPTPNPNPPACQDCVDK
jgi:hypothetical protein